MALEEVLPGSSEHVIASDQIGDQKEGELNVEGIGRTSQLLDEPRCLANDDGCEEQQGEQDTIAPVLQLGGIFVTVIVTAATTTTASATVGMVSRVMGMIFASGLDGGCLRRFEGFADFTHGSSSSLLFADMAQALGQHRIDMGIGQGIDDALAVPAELDQMGLLQDA